MTTSTFTPEQKLAVIKHLAGGKSADTVATIMNTTPAVVVELARTHGYPDVDKLAWAADILEKNLEKDQALEERPLVGGGQIVTREPLAQQPATTPIRPGTIPPLTKPDELRILINTAKGHPSKRIQTAGDRVLDAVDRLKALLREDEEKHAERRAAEAAKAAARAEVERLEAALREAKAKLKGGTTPPAPAPRSTLATPAGNHRSTAPRGEYPCRNDGCDKVISTPQGRGLHEREHCAHRAEAGAA